MKPLFVVWILLYPLFSSVNSYVNTHIRRARGHPQVDYSTFAVGDLIETVVYIWIAYLLWHANP